MIQNKIIKGFYKSRFLYLIFLLPFLYFVIFKYWPMYGVLIAFKKFNVVIGIRASEWVGFKYFEKFLFDPYFWKVVRNTLVINVYSLIFGFPAPVILALLLNEIRTKWYKRTIQTVSYLPHFLSTVVVCGMLSNFLARDGLINQIVAVLGGQATVFLSRPEWFRFIFVSSGIWQAIGWGSIIYLAALSGINPELYEVATIDGANRWRQMLHITLPGIASTISIMLIFRSGSLLSSATEKVLLLYNGSTFEVADVIGTYVYRRGLIDNDFSYATAVGLFNSVINLMILVVVNYFSKKASGTGLW